MNPFDGYSSTLTEDHELPIEIYTGERVAVIGVFINGRTFIGEAKRAPGDPWDEQCGQEIALARALHRASLHLASKHQASLV